MGRVVHRPSAQIAEPVHHGRCVLTPSLGVAVITTFFPADLTLARLKRLAQEHARQLDLDSSHVPPARSMVNYLRHECTDYDLEQSASRHRAACEAIARRFPQLAEECRRQIARRTEQDLQEERAHQMWVAEEERLRAEHHAMVARSREVIKGMRVGQRVGFWLGGYWRTGVITKLGRSRVTVAYRVKTGRERDRTRLVHAALLTLPAGETSESPPPRRRDRARGCSHPVARIRPLRGGWVRNLSLPSRSWPRPGRYVRPSRCLGWSPHPPRRSAR